MRKNGNIGTNEKYLGFLLEIYDHSTERVRLDKKEVLQRHRVSNGLINVLVEEGIMTFKANHLVEWTSDVRPNLKMANRLRELCNKRVRDSIARKKEAIDKGQEQELTTPKTDLEKMLSILPKGATIEIPGGIKITIN